MLTGPEVARHNTLQDLWIIIDGNCFDITDFASSHPGGLKILLKYAGKDATAEYDPIHPPGTIEENLPKDKHLGPVDMSTVEKVAADVPPPLNSSFVPPRLGECLNLDDFEKAAERVLSTKAWGFYSSAADDELTKEWNHSSFNKIRLRPRILRDVSGIPDLSTSMLGHKSNLPIFIAPAAMGRLAHPEGEKCLSRMAARAGIPYIISAAASVSFEEIAKEKTPDQTLFYQLYMKVDRQAMKQQLKKVVSCGYKAICVTVDTPVIGKRERDERAKLDLAALEEPIIQTLNQNPAELPGLAQQVGTMIDSSLSWKDLAWVKKVTVLPIIVKGVQRADDAALCAQYGVDAIYLSNHGGRQLEGAPSSVETLLEIRKFEPQVFQQCEVYVDGGIRRGTDVLKALALGATAVGVGRPFLYSLIFGDAGVYKVIDTLRQEIGQNLRLLGGTKLSDLKRDMVNARALEAGIYDGEYESPRTKAHL